MSGGHWEYLSTKLEDAAEAMPRGAQALLLLAAIEHELDWGYSGDTCPKCAELRTLAAINHYFNDGGWSSTAAVAIVRDRQNTDLLCEDDKARRLVPR